MKFLRGFAVFLAGILCTASLATFIWLLTFQLTILDPNALKQWLRDSGVYRTAVPAIQSANDSSAQQAGKSVVDQALDSTFTSQFVQQQSEGAIDNLYAWLDGKIARPTFSFTTVQKEEFEQQLSKILQPYIAQLPACASASQIQAKDFSCRPSSVSVADFANTSAAAATRSADVFNLPAQSDQLLQTTGLEWLPQLPLYREWAYKLLFILPLTALLGMLLVLLIAEDKLRAIVRLIHHLFFGGLVTCLFAVGIAHLDTIIPMIPGLQDIQSQLTGPAAQQIYQNIGRTTAIISGIASVVWLIAWIILHAIRHKRANALTQVTRKPAEWKTPNTSGAKEAIDTLNTPPKA